MQLSDIDILKALETKDVLIEYFDQNRLQPASYDVLLGSDFLVFDNHKIACIDPKQPVTENMRKVTISDDDFFIIHPGEFVLGATWEKVGVSEKLACQIMGKSSLARLGLIIHTTAGFIDPGNNLRITLEFVNTNTVPIKLYPKMKIAQVAFYELKTPASKPYGSDGLNSKYLNSETVEASQMHKNYKK
jgi:dCTP deaminase